MGEDCEWPKVPTGRLLCAKPVLSGVYAGAEEGTAACGSGSHPVRRDERHEGKTSLTRDALDAPLEQGWGQYLR